MLLLLVGGPGSAPLPASCSNDSVEMLLLLVGGPGSAHSLPSQAQHCKNEKGIILEEVTLSLLFSSWFNHSTLLPCLLVFIFFVYLYQGLYISCLCMMTGEGEWTQRKWVDSAKIVCASLQYNILSTLQSVCVTFIFKSSSEILFSVTSSR